MTSFSRTRFKKLAGILSEDSNEKNAISSVDGVKVQDVIDGVMVVYVSDLLDVIMPNRSYLTPYEETSEAVRKWTDEHDAHYYSWGGERYEEAYHIDKAVDEAKENEKNIVVMDYLS